MMLKVKLNQLINEEIIDSYQEKVIAINNMIKNKTGLGNEFLGWVDWPINYDKEEVKRILDDP